MAVCEREREREREYEGERMSGCEREKQRYFTRGERKVIKKYTKNK